MKYQARQNLSFEAETPDFLKNFIQKPTEKEISKDVQVQDDLPQIEIVGDISPQEANNYLIENTKNHEIIPLKNDVIARKSKVDKICKKPISKQDLKRLKSKKLLSFDE